MRTSSHGLVVFGLLCLLGFGAGISRAAEKEDFQGWLSALRLDAQARNISSATLDDALGGVQLLPRVTELDRSQAEFEMTFSEYVGRFVSDERVRAGRRELSRHRELLAGVHATYGVQPRFVVALWGVESDFGKRTGSFPVIDALTTLAYDGRRATFFRGELLDALSILDQGHIDRERMLGSWAGAMGQPQFMPSSFLRFAVDHDGDARRDIWGSTPDVLASAANYLARSGWHGDRTWGREVRLPSGFDPAAGQKVRRTLAEWQRLGVRQRDGSDLPSADVRASIIRPGSPDGPAYAVYENYAVLLKWNRSDFFATAVGLLSDRIEAP